MAVVRKLLTEDPVKCRCYRLHTASKCSDTIRFPKDGIHAVEQGEVEEVVLVKAILVRHLHNACLVVDESHHLGQIAKVRAVVHDHGVDAQAALGCHRDALHQLAFVEARGDLKAKEHQPHAVVGGRLAVPLEHNHMPPVGGLHIRAVTVELGHGILLPVLLREGIVAVTPVFDLGAATTAAAVLTGRGEVGGGHVCQFYGRVVVAVGGG